MGRSCRVCLSPYRVRYDELRLKGFDIKEIWRISRAEYKEDIPLYSFYYHFENHLENIIKEGEKAYLQREKQIEKTVTESIEAAQMLKRNLELCNQQLALLSDKVIEPEARREIRDIIFKSNQTAEILLRFIDKIQIKPKETEGGTLEKVLYCMQDFPPELMIKFTERWKNYGHTT